MTFTFACPVGDRAGGGGSGIGGQMITSCPICGEVSANTAMRSHRPVELNELTKRLRATEELSEMYPPGADLVSVYLDMEKQIKELTRQRDHARQMFLEGEGFTSSVGDESRYSHILNNNICERCGTPRDGDRWCDGCGNLRPTPPRIAFDKQEQQR